MLADEEIGVRNADIILVYQCTETKMNVENGGWG